MTYSKALTKSSTMNVIDSSLRQSGEINNNLPILREENVQMIVQSAPNAYNTNSLSSMRCADFGKNLLDEIERSGMTDELDKRCADYIDKAKRTLKAMNERRAPFTKLFDQIRSEFTGMENNIDPAKKDTVPYLIQQKRNAFAAKKREDAERARQEEMRRQQREQAIARYTQEAEDDYRRQFDSTVTSNINDLTSLNQSLTIENFDEVSEKIKNFKTTLGNEWFQSCQSHAHKPYEISDAEAIQIRQSILNRLSKQFKEQFASEVGEYRDTIADVLPSKKRELERMANASTEEQMRMKAMRSRWALFMLAWILKMKAENSSRHGSTDSPVRLSTRASGVGVSRRKFSRKGSTPKLVRAEPKNTGLSSPRSTLSRSNSSAAPSSSSISSTSCWCR